MDTKVFCLRSKLKRLLYKMLEGKCPKRIEHQLDDFLILLWKQEDAEIESALRVFPFLVEWLKEAILTWSSTKVTPPTTVGSFAINLASLLSKKEERFCSLNTNNFFIKLINVLKTRQADAAAPIKLGYIKLLSAFLDHKSGLEWMIACNFWRDIYKLALTTEEKVAQESTKFMSKILENTIDLDETFCDDIIKKIMTPLGENVYKQFKAVDDELALESLKPTLKLMGDILECLMGEIYLKKKDFGVALLFLKNFHLEERISDFMIIAQSKSLVFDLGKIMFIMQFLELYVKMITKSTTVAQIDATIDRIRRNFLTNMYKGEFEDVMGFCKFGVLYWHLMKLTFPTPKNKTGSDLSSEILFMLQMPNWNVFLKYCMSVAECEEEYGDDDIRLLYFDKILKLMTQDMVRVYYYWRDHPVPSSKLFILCKLGGQYIQELVLYLNRDQAVMMFQDWVYYTKDVFFNVKGTPQKLEIFLNEINYFGRAFDILVLYIENFQITWRDCFEAIELIDIALQFLSMTIPEWPSELIVKILKLVNIAIVKYMSPNLALLVENPTDSIMDLLGRLMSAKLHCEVLEVRKNSLEIVSTMTSLSTNKFPSLQKVLMDSELPTLVVKMSTCDGESFVRATAIKCLQEMIQVEEIWNNALKTEDLPQKMRDILLNEAEGIVRVEAATFMCVAYEYQQFAKENLDRIYETMIYSSTTDLHWEVKVRALNFWDKVIKNHLQNQGMIDDSFPNVTFSKEHRKIVTLTDSEIRKRLLKVLGQLSSIGCLGVLMSAIKDDCDMEVSKTAVKITQRLIDLFKKYNVRSDSSTPNSPALTENGMSAAVSLSSGISVDESMDSPASSSNHPEVNEEIIDQIVNSKDVSLLKSVYTPSDYGSVSNYDIQVRKVVTPNEFLQFCQQDLNSLIAEKKNWLNGIEDLGSLLDDMLKSYEDDVNNMDCY